MQPPDLGPRIHVGERARGVSQSGKLSTFDAIEADTNTPLLVCALKPSLASDPEIRRVVRHGLDALARLEHPGIAKLVAAVEDPEQLAFAIRRIDGAGVSRLLREGAIFTEREVVSAGRSLLEALAHTHGRGVCFGNVKSTNVVLHHDRRRAVIVGLPKPPPQFTSIRHVATYVGVPHECPPELLERGELDARSDLYGVGLVLYEMCAGALPFRAQLNFGDVVAAVLEDGVPPLTETLPDIAPALATVIARAVARDPSERYSTAAEMGEALARAGARDEPLLSRERLSGIVRETFPTPIADLFASIDASDDPQTQIHRLVDAGHVLIQLLAFAALASTQGEHGLERAGLDLGRPLLSTWTQSLRLAASARGVIPELATTWRPLEALVQLRNEIRHGVSPSVGTARRRLHEARPRLEQALTASRFLRKYALLVVQRCDYVGGSFTCRVLRLRGARGGEVAESMQTLQPLESGKVYLATPTLDRFVDLSPFVLHRACPVCEEDELFLYESSGDRVAHYRSSHNGHPLRDEEALDELERRGLLRPR